jgi:hypothetical protein
VDREAEIMQQQRRRRNYAGSCALMEMMQRDCCSEDKEPN